MRKKVYLRALLDTLLERIPDRTLHSTSLCFLQKLVVNFLVYKCAGSSTATLALQGFQDFSTTTPNKREQIREQITFSRLYLIEEESKVGKLHGLVDVSVLTDYEWRLPAKLQCHRFEVAPCSQLKNNLPSFSRSRESKLQWSER